MLEALKRVSERAKKLSLNDLMLILSKDIEYKDFMIKLNTIEQLYEAGVNNKGQQIGEYARNTIQGTSAYEGKIEKGQRYDHITLNDTGDFYNSFTVTLDTDFSLTINADTIKGNEDLMFRYPDIIGLDDRSMSRLVAFTRERAVKITRNILLGING